MKIVTNNQFFLRKMIWYDSERERRIKRTDVVQHWIDGRVGRDRRHGRRDDALRAQPDIGPLLGPSSSDGQLPTDIVDDDRAKPNLPFVPVRIVGQGIGELGRRGGTWV